MMHIFIKLNFPVGSTHRTNTEALFRCGLRRRATHISDFGFFLFFVQGRSSVMLLSQIRNPSLPSSPFYSYPSTLLLHTFFTTIMLRDNNPLFFLFIYLL